MSDLFYGFLIGYAVMIFILDVIVGVKWTVNYTDKHGSKSVIVHRVRFPEVRYRLMMKFRWLGRYAKAKRLLKESRIPTPFFKGDDK